MSTTNEDTKWYWCLKHGTVEQGVTCPAANRMGPYDTADQAAAWRERVERRNQQWDDDDERWEHGSRD
jgi:hypothetical protein